MAYQQAPDSILWCVRDDGVLSGLTYQRTDNVVAWHRHILGGKSDTTKNIIQQQISFTANTIQLLMELIIQLHYHHMD